MTARKQEVYWLGDPKNCDLCKQEFETKPGFRFVDGRTRLEKLGSTWCLMCWYCFELYGAGLGAGKGQMYMYNHRKGPSGSHWKKVGG